MIDKNLAWRAGLFCGLILTAAMLLLWATSLPVEKRRSEPGARRQAASPGVDPTLAFAPEVDPGFSLRPAKAAKVPSSAWKGRENNFIGEIREWSRKDPEAALAWARTRPDDDDARKEALIDACFQIAQTDAERAITLAEQFDLDRDVVLTNLAQQWANKDLLSASRWIATQSDDDQRNALATGLALVWSKSDPADAARFVTQRMSPGLARDSAVLMVLHQWALVDLAGATTWARQFPAGPLRDTALDELGNVADKPP